MESILNSIKKLLGITEEQKHFDDEIIMHINSTFSRLNELGVGPVDGYRIEDDLNTWNEFIGTDPKLDDVVTYVYLSVKLVFDPPASSSILASMERKVDKLEFSLNVKAES